MILPDINLLVYAHDELARPHQAARQWWEAALNGANSVGLPWVVSLGFVRLVTHPRVMVEPVSPTVALDCVDGWLQRPSVQVLEPGPRHLSIVRQLFLATDVAAGLTTDTHLAALAIEHQCELHSNDGDFARFPGLNWHNPLSG